MNEIVNNVPIFNVPMSQLGALRPGMVAKSPKRNGMCAGRTCSEQPDGASPGRQEFFITDNWLIEKLKIDN